jgi:hypothetical protein
MVRITRTGDTKRGKANFPFRLYVALFSVAVVLWLAWFLWPPQIRVTRPTVDIAADKIIVTTALTNGTSAIRTVTIRFDLGYQTLGTDYAPGEFRLITSREVTAEIDARTTKAVSCEFPPFQKPLPYRSDAQIVSRR